MNATCSAETQNENKTRSVREFLSLKEVVTLANVPEERVRKDIDTGLLKARLLRFCAEPRSIFFKWDDVLTFALIYGNKTLNGSMRRIALDKLSSVIKEDVIFSFDRCLECSPFRYGHSRDHWKPVYLDKFVLLDMERAYHAIVPRVEDYACGLTRTEENRDVMGGVAVFAGTRVPVLHVGKMVENGVPIDTITEDYEFLNDSDVRFAHLYYRAHPSVGRPRISGEKTSEASA